MIILDLWDICRGVSFSQTEVHLLYHTCVFGGKGIEDQRACILLVVTVQCYWDGILGNVDEITVCTCAWKFGQLLRDIVS